MRQIALCVLFALSFVVSLGCKSEEAKVSGSGAKEVGTVCMAGTYSPCQFIDERGSLADGVQQCYSNGTGFGLCVQRPIAGCVPGTTTSCLCPDGNMGYGTCTLGYDGYTPSIVNCQCQPSQQGAGGGMNTTTSTDTTTDTGTGGSAPTTTTTTMTETNSGTGGGDAGQGGQAPQPVGCDKPVQFQLDPNTTPNNVFVVESGWSLVMNSIIVVNPCDEDQKVKQLTESRWDWNGVIEDFINPVAYFADVPNPVFYAGTFVADGSVGFSDIVVPANSAHRLLVVMTIPETKPTNYFGYAHSGDSGKFVPSLAWSGDDWKPITINGDLNATRVIIHASIPQVQHQWYVNPTKLHDGMNELIKLNIVTSPGHEVDIRQLVFKIDHSPELTLDATALENQGASPIYISDSPMMIEPGTKVFHPEWNNRAVYMNATDGELAVSDVWQNHLTISLNLVVSGVTPQSWIQVKLDDSFAADHMPRRLQVVANVNPGVVVANDLVNNGQSLVSAFLWTDKSEKGNHKVTKPSSLDYYGMYGIGNVFNTALTSAQ